MPRTFRKTLVAAFVTCAAGALAQSDTMGRGATGPLTGLGVSGTGSTSGVDATTGNSTGTGATLGPGPALGATPGPNTLGRSTGPLTGTGSAGVAPGRPITPAPGITSGMTPATTPGTLAPGNVTPGTSAGLGAPGTVAPGMVAPGFAPGAFGFGPGYGTFVAPGLWGPSAYGAYGSGFTPGYGPGVYAGTAGDVLATEAIPGAPGTGTSGIPFGTREPAQPAPQAPPAQGTAPAEAAAPYAAPEAAPAPESAAAPPVPPVPPVEPGAPVEGGAGARVNTRDLVRAPIGSSQTLTSRVANVLGPQLFTLAGDGGDVPVLLPREPDAPITPGAEVTVTGTVRPFVDADVYVDYGYFDAEAGLVEQLRNQPVLVARSVDQAGLALLGPATEAADATPIAVAPRALARAPDTYDGLRVTVRGDGAYVVNSQAFTLADEGGEIVVLHPTPLSDSPAADAVTVTGTVRNVSDELLEDYPWLADADALEGRPIVVAEAVLQE